ncbi:AAA family ATPase [Rhizobium sp. C1]|uniref:AAA family ATPase n=1 Tax=Rhizobium sp. C1 TaxID=1349799 RepID=UPI001E2D8BF8|nr:ATP-binding protein [Rhizobium sp. C1]MCD2177364.1 ATP-binding protein [Rhizobium sp. C1]
MATLADRIAHYLQRRWERRANRELYERAENVGLIERAELSPDVPGSGLKWQLASPPLIAFSGDIAADTEKVARLMKRRGIKSTEPESLLDFEADIHVDERAQTSDKRRPVEVGLNQPSSNAPITGDASAKRLELLRLIRAFRTRRPVMETAVALLVSRAVANSIPDLSMITEVIRRPSPIVAIRAASRGFEDAFGGSLEHGLILPFRTSPVDGLGGNAIGGRYQDHMTDPHRIMTFSGKTIRKQSPASLRRALAKAGDMPSMPIVIADELREDLPSRVIAGVDLVIETGEVDCTMLAELMHVCLGVAPNAALRAMEQASLRPQGLGLDDLALALRPGRSVERIIWALKELITANDAEKDEENGDEADHSERGSGKRERLRRFRKDSNSFELIQPAAIERQKSIVEAGEQASLESRAIKPLHIETLAGYGPARDWALELKDDLALWRDGTLAWSDMSTKLLLSGPPGTGKTTFARALCNSLQVPLLATSLSHMLEPGYLGEVLKAMSDAFEVARANAPSILFLDEIDNIGKRGSGQKDGDYWNSLVNRALELLDGVGKTEGVVIIGATNLPDRIDPALVRSGRLERHIRIPTPDTDALAGILAHHLGQDFHHVMEGAPNNVRDGIGAGERPRKTQAENSPRETGQQLAKPTLKGAKA